VQHVEVKNGAGFAVTDLVLRPVEDAVESSGAAAGTAVVREWGSARRVVDVATTASAVLTVSESYNEGWEATAGGRRLQPVLVDGWKQGWVVPEGVVGLVELEFIPQGPFVVGLSVGAGLAGTLVAMSLFLWPRRRSSPPDVASPDDRHPVLRRPALYVGLVVLALVSPWLALGAALGWASTRTAYPVLARVRVAGLSALPAAALLTLVLGSSVQDPPGIANAMTAATVGLALGLSLVARPTVATSREGAG
jgi:arabinofuranan 3-O-arabinosyltransferase